MNTNPLFKSKDDFAKFQERNRTRKNPIREKPKKGTIICIPVINVFGFIHMDREFPDGRDLNRVFPGTKGGY